MGSQPKLLGLIGFPLTHSFSKGYFEHKFSDEKIERFLYLNFPIESIRQLPCLISDNPNLIGLNVTIPYKESVIPYLTGVDPVAAHIGAVNVIRIIHEDQQVILKGYNTDVIGIERTLANWVFRKGIKALVFGTGGASKAVSFVLKNRDIPYRFVSRSSDAVHLQYKDLGHDLLNEYKLLINCTPVGMFPDDTASIPIPYGYLTAKHYLLDLIYNPPITKFMKEGISRGSSVQGGSLMFREQAEASWKIWTRMDPR